MTAWNPVWQVTVNGIAYTSSVVANLTITSGRTNIYTQAYAGYCTLNILNLNAAAVAIAVNDSVSIQVQDSTATFVPIFGGTVVDLGIEIRNIGNTYTQTIVITALGALSRLPKATTTGVLAKALDGEQIAVILEDLLLNNWSEVPAALTWANYVPATATWATAENVGLGEIDPGNYDLANRASSVTDIYSLVSALATSGLGYLYEDASGLISYADSLHRSIYLATYGYTDLSANDALGAGIKIQTRAGDIRNDITLKYGSNSTSSVTDEDATSIANYGRLAQIISTTLFNASDAIDQAAFYLTLRASPQANLETITYELTNSDLSDTDRDALINIFMGLPVTIADLPLNMSSGTFIGFVEGWTFRAQFNQLSVTATLSPLAYSLQAMAWSDVAITESWNTIVGSLDWANATIVA